MRQAVIIFTRVPEAGTQGIVAQVLDKRHAISLDAGNFGKFVALFPQFQIRFLYHILGILNVAHQPEGHSIEFGMAR